MNKVVRHKSTYIQVAILLAFAGLTTVATICMHHDESKIVKHNIDVVKHSIEDAMNDAINTSTQYTIDTYKIAEAERIAEEEAARKAAEEEAKRRAAEEAENSNKSENTGVLTQSNGINWFNGHKETYYNLDMSGVIANARAAGIDGEYWVRGDGVKMYGNYVIVAAQMDKGTIIETSLGTGIVLDWCPAGTIDIAVTW